MFNWLHHDAIEELMVHTIEADDCQFSTTLLTIRNIKHGKWIVVYFASISSYALGEGYDFIFFETI